MNVTHEDQRAIEVAVENAIWNFLKRLYDCKTVDEVIDKFGEKQLRDNVTHR
jgi:hypothetical protein